MVQIANRVQNADCMTTPIKRFPHDGYTLVVDKTGPNRIVRKEFPDGSVKILSNTPLAQSSRKRNEAGEPKPLRTGCHPNFLDCSRLVEDSYGRATPHACGGCQGGQFTTVFQCSLYGDCAPMAWAELADKTVTPCNACKSYSP